MNWRLEPGNLQACSLSGVRMEHTPGIDWNYWDLLSAFRYFGPLLIRQSAGKLTMLQIWQCSWSTCWRFQGIFSVCSPQTEDDRTVANKCYHMQIIQKKRTTTTNTYQMFISLFEHLVMVVALSRWRNVRSKWPPTVIATGRCLSKRHTTRRDGSESPRPCWYFWCFWCAASWKTKKRDESSFPLWCFMPWKSSKRCTSAEVSLFFIFHFDPCWHTSTILRCTNRRIADVFPLPFWYIIFIYFRSSCWHAVRALSGMEFMNYCWVVGERLSQASIILKRRNPDGQERVSGNPASLVHTSIHTRQKAALTMMLSPVNDQLSYFFNILLWWRHLH